MNKDCQGWRKFTQITNDDLEKLGETFQIAETVTIPFTGREVYKLNSWMTEPHKPFKFLSTPQGNTLVMECG